MKTIAIAGEIYGSNLGDGAIAECLAFLFRREAPEITVRALDISGRAAWAPVAQAISRKSRWGWAKRKVFAVRPVRTLLKLAQWLAVTRRQCARAWLPVLSDASELVVGGGQLLMDNFPNFPVRIDSLTSLARSLGIVYHFAACGVGKKWSAPASFLFRRALEGAASITVRDANSLRHLERSVPHLSSRISVTFDPAIWAAEVYGRDPLAESKPTIVGLGVINLDEVNLYAPPGRTFTEQALVRFWVDVMARLYQAGVSCEVFTNGSPADQAFAEHVCREGSTVLAVDVPLRDRPHKPRELALGISRYRSVVSTRLHASVLALSYGISTTGLIWDDKIRAFFDETGRGHLCVSIYDRDPEAVVQGLSRAEREGLDPHALELWRSRAVESVERVLSGRDDRQTGKHRRDES